MPVLPKITEKFLTLSKGGKWVLRSQDRNRYRQSLTYYIPSHMHSSWLVYGHLKPLTDSKVHLQHSSLRFFGVQCVKQSHLMTWALCKLLSIYFPMLNALLNYLSISFSAFWSHSSPPHLLSRFSPTFHLPNFILVVLSCPQPHDIQFKLAS